MVYYIAPVLFLLAFWCPCMTINVSIHYNGGLLPDIIFVDPILSNTMLDVVLYCLRFCFSCVLLPDIILLTQCCVLLPDIILLTQCYCDRGTWVNAMERFRSCGLRNCGLLSHLIGFSLTRIPCSVCVLCFLPIHSGHQWTYQPGSHRQEEGRTGFLIHLLSAMHASIFLARRIQPFLSLVAVKSNFVY